MPFSCDERGASEASGVCAGRRQGSAPLTSPRPMTQKKTLTMPVKLEIPKTRLAQSDSHKTSSRPLLASFSRVRGIGQTVGAGFKPALVAATRTCTPPTSLNPQCPLFSCRKLPPERMETIFALVQN